MTAPVTSLELRCPVGPKELLMRIKQKGEKAYVNPDNNALCLKCSFCTRTARKHDPSVLRIIHEFSIIGELINSEIEYR